MRNNQPAAAIAKAEAIRSPPCFGAIEAAAVPDHLAY